MKVWACVVALMSLAAMAAACGERAQSPTPAPTAIAAALPATQAAEISQPPAPTASPAPEPSPTAAPASTRALGPRSGSPAPDFQLTLLNGETLSLSDLKGKVVVLNFWASWCGPCRWEMPDFEGMWQEYRERDVVFVGVAVSDWKDDAQAFADKVGVTYPLGVDANGQITRAYSVVSMPTTYFIDREGNVARKLSSAANKGVLRVFLDGQVKN